MLVKTLSTGERCLWQKSAPLTFRLKRRSEDFRARARRDSELDGRAHHIGECLIRHAAQRIRDLVTALRTRDRQRRGVRQRLKAPPLPIELAVSENHRPVNERDMAA